jgi:undecaprenyl-diphosphatase
MVFFAVRFSGEAMIKLADAGWQRLRSIELAPLLILLFAVLCVIGFAKLASEVAQGDLHDFDRAILLSMREPADHAKALGPKWLQVGARDITSLGSPAVLTLITLAAAAYLLLKRRMASTLLLAGAVIGGAIMSNTLKYLIARPRPDFVAEVAQIHSYSFPSGHSLLSAVVFLTVGALLARLERRTALKVFVLGLAFALTLLVGLTRIYLGVHWPTDVLAGWAAGAAWAILCWMFAAWLQDRGTIDRDDRPAANAPSPSLMFHRW